MSVIVKGMEMPESCNVCIMCVDGKYGERCLLTNQYIEPIIDDCPLVALPEKHGRIIDMDEYCILNGCYKADDDCKNCVIRDCETILESEE